MRRLKPTPKLLLMDKILHDPKDPKLWELWYIPYNGSCRILSINRSATADEAATAAEAHATAAEAAPPTDEQKEDEQLRQ